MNPKRFVAVDWSGNVTLAGQRRHIYVASWCDGVVTLQNGRTREGVCDLLLAAAQSTPEIVVGLDFAFSFPAWWLREQHCEDAPALWRRAAKEGERWLHEGRAPFWGRPGQPRPTDHHVPAWRGFRETDRAMEVMDCAIRPKSPFQIGGAGAVGTGSIRGMPILSRLHQAGFHVWPFQEVSLPLALEIYPRLFTGAVNKSSREARQAYLERARYANLPTAELATAAASEDAFDALCSVLGMVDHAKHLNTLNQKIHPDAHLEGAIWNPRPDPDSGHPLTETDRALESAIADLLAQRGQGKTICPSEAARLLDPVGWEALMPRTRAAARRLVEQGAIVITQRGKTVDPSRTKGPIRLRRA
jgi:Protein of unknown function (DUF3253)